MERPISVTKILLRAAQRPIHQLAEIQAKQALRRNGESASSGMLYEKLRDQIARQAVSKN